MDEFVGVYLKNVRESKNITLEDVARETKIQKRYIEAIEAEQYEEIPGETYIRGFLRNYAEAVGLNPEIIIEKYDAKKRKETEEEHQNLDGKEIKIGTEHKKVIKNGLIAFFILGFFYLMVNFVGLIYKNMKHAKGYNVKTEKIIEKKLESLNDNSVRKEETIVIAEEKKKTTDASVIVTKNEMEKRIKITAKGSSWIEIRENGDIKFQGTINEGVTKEINSYNPINIIVGDASNVKIEYNGEDIGILGKSQEVIRKEF